LLSPRFKWVPSMADRAELFARYSEIIPDYRDFLDSLRSEPPNHVRVNLARADVDGVKRALAGLGLDATAEPWMGELLRVEGRGPKKLGSTLAHALGHYYVQSASSAVSALALGTMSGDAVLDLCAAPGSKTTMIALAATESGFVVANEPSHKRLNSLIANLRRMGLANVLVTAYAGQNFPLKLAFDRVLVDAPCSGEGTWLGRTAHARPMTGGQRENLVQRQKAILARAVETLKPGGELVYSTCTYAPEENELVVAYVLSHHELEVMELGLDIPALPGLTEWEGKPLPSRLSRGARLYPHRFSSEGFFVIRLAKPR